VTRQQTVSQLRDGQATFDRIIQIERWQHDSFLVRKLYVDIAGGDLIAGILLSQIVYWNSPGQDGTDRVRVERDGRRWLVRAYDEWWEDCRVTEKRARNAISSLRQIKDDQGNSLIETKVWKFQGSPKLHIWLDRDLFARIWSQCVFSSSARGDTSDTGDNMSPPSDPGPASSAHKSEQNGHSPDLPKGQDDLPKGQVDSAERASPPISKTLTETTPPELTDKSVNSVGSAGADADPPSPNGNGHTQNGKSDPLTEQACQVIDELNRLLKERDTNYGRYKHAKSNLKPIRARLREGASLDECLLVVVHRIEKWWAKPEMREYLRPVTLFRPTKFDGYLQDALAWQDAGGAAALGEYGGYYGDEDRDEGVQRERSGF